MALALNDHDTEILLKDKNHLNESILDKYRLAGQISQTCLTYVISLINDSYHLGKISPPLTTAEICALGDSYLYSALSSAYNKAGKAVTEKGIAHPVSIDLNDTTNGIAPELIDDKKVTNRLFVPGDIVKITLGSHVDGYTALVSHTLVIYPQAESLTDPKPQGPLLGAKADAICASYVATEAIVALLGCSMNIQKLPVNFNVANNQITGSMIRKIVDSIAETYGCIVVPGSKVRRIRRFLAGQAENIVAEKEFKGVIWAEAHQEHNLLQKSSQKIDVTDIVKTEYSSLGITTASAIPTDEFIIEPGEVYVIDIKMASITQFNKPGLVTLQNIDGYSGKNHDQNELSASSNIFIRDFAVNHNLRLKNARITLSKVEKISSVYPFKLSHLSENFPIKTKLTLNEQKETLEKIKKDVIKSKLGLAECLNNHLIVAKKIQLAKFLPLEVILTSFNENARPNGAGDLTLANNGLPGFEIPLPKLGLTVLKLKSLLKKAESIDVARELTTIVLNENSDNSKQPEVLRLAGGLKPSWVHSNFTLLDEDIIALIKLGQDQRFGIKIKQCQPMKLTDIKNDGTEKMSLD